jgi:glycosyltransferase involved in cell wall biosynthesis
MAVPPAGIASDEAMRRSKPRKVLVDAARLAFRYEAQRRAVSRLGQVDVLYERQATFQDVGRSFQKRGIPWVIESNGPFWYEASRERNSLALVGRAKTLELAAYRDADLVVVVSEALRDIVAEESGRPRKDILVLPNATDVDRFDPDRVAAERRFDGITIGFVGYLAEWAGIDLLIQAMAELRRGGNLVNAVIVGDGPARPGLEELTRHAGVAKQVEFLGRVPWTRVPGLLAGADLAYSGQRAMAIGSMYHSPQKLYEYRAMGLPVVAAGHDDARRLIVDGSDGFLFKSDSVDSLAGALRAALAVPNLAAMAASARASVTADHTWNARIETLLSELAARGIVRRSVRKKV